MPRDLGDSQSLKNMILGGMEILEGLLAGLKDVCGGFADTQVLVMSAYATDSGRSLVPAL